MVACSKLSISLVLAAFTSISCAILSLINSISSRFYMDAEVSLFLFSSFIKFCSIDNVGSKSDNRVPLVLKLLFFLLLIFLANLLLDKRWFVAIFELGVKFGSLNAERPGNG